VSSKRKKTILQRYNKKLCTAEVPQNIVLYLLTCHAEEGHKEESRVAKHSSLAAKSKKGCKKI